LSHTIAHGAIKNYSFEHLIAASHSKTDSKTLKAVVIGKTVTYEVESHGKPCLITDDGDLAIEAYNHA